MSRTEEIRKKLKAKFKDINPECGDFNLRVDAHIKDRSASALSSKFMEKLFNTHKAQKPSDLESWTVSELKGKFKSAVHPPDLAR